ncbi:hypothetical protein ABIE66_004928 [Peribacillus sp. B2I2]
MFPGIVDLSVLIMVGVARSTGGELPNILV